MVNAAILDMGAGNLFSLKRGLKRTGADVKIIDSLEKFKNQDAIVLPGVGSFSAAAKSIETNREFIKEFVGRGVSILGICLGMQLFFDESEEGAGKGLSLFKGDVVRLPGGLKVPHMGWNRINFKGFHQLLDGVEDGAWTYFVHSYYPRPEDAGIIITETEYGVNFPSIIAEENIFGTQFHPEKSGHIGAKILDNFIRLCRR